MIKKWTSNNIHFISFKPYGTYRKNVYQHVYLYNCLILDIDDFERNWMRDTSNQIWVHKNNAHFLFFFFFFFWIKIKDLYKYVSSA